MHVALFGGAFNPPHIAHQAVTLHVLATQPVDQLWWLPVPVHAFAKNLLDWPTRAAMCQKALRHFDARRVRLCDIERQLPAPNYTVDTLRALHRRHPGWRFSWIIGSDNLDRLEDWHEIEAMRQLCDFIVLPRAGHDQAALLPKVSSSQIRSLLANGAGDDRLVHLLDVKVLQMIRYRKLYLDVG